ncbi:MAG TPA: GntR family transcriptional regulator [Flavobacterium sp.]|uniref:GntR family transcriptional regulator n=1 Tax=unclassified Flavobacterium TaxID=196869 RepID=UPI000E81DB27|nr:MULTISPECIES: GntR family transcriptional regulator [unclassified Flavobacterium]HBI00801.1 transcriptional regulator [Flavobacterium sp.]HRE78483.1 GntR family transcriptional regulator [Flavobacterium sp.]
MKLIVVDTQSGIPKYKQIIQSIEIAIAENRLQKGDRLPSVNKVSLEFSISRDTVLLAYDELKKRGILFAILGKGYYVKSVEFSFEQRYFVLFDELNAFKEDLYTSFLETIDNKAQVDIYFHHFNLLMFQKLINESNGNYSKYIIMPTNLIGAAAIIKTLPKSDVYILDQTNDELRDYPSVHQNFVKDMYSLLLEGKSKIDLYDQLILIFPGQKEPLGMVEGFEKFCSDYHFTHQVVSYFEAKYMQKGIVFVIPNDRQLVEVIEYAKEQNFRLGIDYGIISYNDTPLKKVVENGITTISTNFKKMGKSLAEMVLTNQKFQLENECQLIVRKSL